MTQEVSTHSQPIRDRIQLVQTITIVWMVLEAGAALLAALEARSPALLAFGGDSLIELLSASLVFWRFKAHGSEEHAERIASRIAGSLLFLLGGFVIVTSLASLLGFNQPNHSYLGVGILMAAISIMPWLAREKRRLSALTSSSAMRADAAQSYLCAYLASVTLSGLLVNAIWHVAWADPLAALAAVPLIAYEGTEAFRGKPCVCT